MCFDIAEIWNKIATISKFLHCFTKLSAFDTKMTGYYQFTFLFSIVILLNAFIFTTAGVSIALDKALFATKKYLYFSYFSTETYVVGTH